MQRRDLVGLIVLVLVGCQSSTTNAPAGPESPKFELQGFSISRDEKKESYGGRSESVTVTYKGRGNLVLVSPSRPDGRHYEVWLRLKATCGKETEETIQQIAVLN